MLLQPLQQLVLQLKKYILPTSLSDFVSRGQGDCTRNSPLYQAVNVSSFRWKYRKSRRARLPRRAAKYVIPSDRKGVEGSTAPSSGQKIPPRGFALVGMTNSGRVKTLPYGCRMRYIVGAVINRPAHRSHVFALAFGEFVICYGTDERCSPLQWMQKKGGSRPSPTDMVRIVGLEPTRRWHRNLNPTRLPIPSYPQIPLIFTRGGTRGGAAA